MKTPEYQKRASKAYEARQNEKGLFKKALWVTIDEYEAIKLLLEKLRCNNNENGLK